MDIGSMHLNWIDIVFLGFMLFSMLIAYVRGFVREALSLATWVAAIITAIAFTPDLVNLLQPYIVSETFRKVLSAIVLLLIVLILGAVINHYVSSFVKSSSFRGTDRILGTFFGAARGVLLLALIILLLSVTPLSKSTSWKQSYFLPHLTVLSTWIESWFPEQMQTAFDEARAKLQQEKPKQPPPTQQPQNEALMRLIKRVNS